MLIPLRTNVAIARDERPHAHEGYIESQDIARAMRIRDLPPVPLISVTGDDVVAVDGTLRPSVQKITLKDFGRALVDSGSLPSIPDDGILIMELADMIATLPPEMRGPVAAAFFLVIGPTGRHYDPAEFYDRCNVPLD